jgi:hypothetical protein
MTRRDLILGASTLTAATALPLASNAGDAAKPSIKRGLSFYSYQEEYYKREMTLEDCFAAVASMGATGVQLIAEAMVPRYPNPPAEWVDQWHMLLAKRRLQPTNPDTFVDVYLALS